MTPRAVAADILHRILAGGAYSNILIHTGTADLVERDRRFVQRVVFGAIRHLLVIDSAIVETSTRPVQHLDVAVVSSLRIACEELLFMGTPPHAAIDGAVEAVRERAGERATGFTNAVLRSIAAASRPDVSQATALGVEPWILERLADAYGESWASHFLEASNGDPLTGLRVRTAATLKGRAIAGIDGALLISDPGQVARAVDGGHAAVMDPASVAVGLAMAPAPGDTVLDATAAPGAKTLHLWDQMEGRGRLIAADRHARRLTTARDRLPRAVAAVVADGRHPPFRHGVFDCILIDAPCTGLGVLRRRPEIRHRLRPSSPQEAGVRQRRLVEASMPLLKSGGRLVYSVCTVFPEETVEVTSGLGFAAPDGIPGENMGDGILLAPHTTGTDAMYIAVLQT